MRFSRVQNDFLTSFNVVVIKLVGKHAFQGSATVILNNIINNLGNIPVLVASLDGSKSSLSRVPGSSNGISDLGRDLAIGIRESNGVSENSGKAINLSTKSNLNDITSLQSDILFLSSTLQRRVMGNNVVGTDRGGERDTLNKLLVFSKDLGKFFFNEGIASSNDVGNLSTNNAERLDMSKSLVGNLTSSLVLGKSLRVLESIVN